MSQSTTELACVGCPLGSGEKGVVLSGARTKCLKGAQTLPKKCKDPPALPLETTEQGLVDGCRPRADYKI